MTKAKNAKASGSVHNKVLYSRVSYLYQAASYLATHDTHSKGALCSHPGKDEDAEVQVKIEAHNTVNAASASRAEPHLELERVSRRLISDLRSVSTKAQLRMAPAMRHTICKNCDSFLLDGTSCSSVLENRSKGGKKPWADVLVRKCNACGIERRYPLAAKRQKRKNDRKHPGIVM